MTVYILQHESEDRTDVKLLGVYANEADAVEAMGRLSRMPGFRDHPAGFSVDAYELSEDHWSSGFTSTGPEPATRTQAA